MDQAIEVQQQSAPVKQHKESLALFLEQIRKYPILSAVQEQELAQKWRKTQDEEAVHQLVSSYLRLVVKIAMQFRGYGLPINELVSEGNVGVMEAIKRFDPDRGFRFSTYAMWWIKASIQDYILKSWSLVKMGTTAAQKKLFFNLGRLKTKLQTVDETDLSHANAEIISKTLNLNINDVIMMNQRLSGPDHSLNSPYERNGDGHGGEWIDFLVDESDNQEDVYLEEQEYGYRKMILNQAIAKLEKRERDIFVARRLKNKPKTLEELSLAYSISRERVRQIEAKAMNKVQKCVLELTRKNVFG